MTTTADDASGVAANCTTGSTTACTLRDALAAAAASTSTGLTVNFSPTVFLSTNTAAQNTITLGNAGVLNVPRNTTIQGLTTGSGASLKNLVTVSGDNTTNIFYLPSGTAAINNLTMTAGYAQGATFGGAVDNNGTLTLNQDTISNNKATLFGGGIYNGGTLTITNSTISGNQSNSSSGGGIYHNTGTLTISDSTIANNAAASLAGGIYLNGGSASMTYVTIVGNTATTGGGVYTTITPGINESIVALNSATPAGSHADIDGSYSNPTQDSFADNNSSATSPYSASILGVAPLGFYGGPTETMPLLPTSQAFCAGPNGSGTDQRGASRTMNYPGIQCNDPGATNSQYSLAFTTEPAASYAVGVNFSTTPVVSFEDDGYVLPFTSTGTPLKFTDSANLLAGTKSANFASGSATPTGANIAQATTNDKLTATYTLNTQGPPTVLTAVSNSFNVLNPVTGFTISTLTTPVTAGTAQTVTVTALNGSATSTNYGGTVTFTSTDSASAVPSSYTFTGTDAGVHTFTNGLTFKTSGMQTLTVTDSLAHVSKISNSVTVTAGAAASVAATGTTTISVATGAAFGSTALQVQVLDAFANAVGGATVTYSVPPSGASAALGAATCTTNASGMCSVTATASTLPGTYSITASVNGVATPATFHVTNTGPAIYTVTVATDTTTGTPGNCTEGGTTDSNCSLRDALAAAAALPASSTIPAIIQFSATRFTAATTITLAHGAMTIPDQTTIQGLTTGSGASLTNLITVSGNHATTIFNLASGVTAAISNLTITAAVAQTTGGGAINNAGTLTLNQDTISNSSARSSGGGVSNYGTLTVSNSTFSGNTAPGGYGGAIYHNGPGLLTVSNSTFTGNSTGNNGGAIYAYEGNATLTNTTITGNTAKIGGGVFVFAGGMYPFNMSNTIVEGNTATVSYADIDGMATALTNGLYGTSSSGTSGNTAAGLGLVALGFYGGPTQTMPAVPTGRAFCAGGGSGSDQRGVARPATYGIPCVDIGATNSNYSLVFTTQPVASYPVNALFTTTPVLSLEDDGFVLPFTSATTPAAFTDTDSAFSGSAAGFFNNGNATPTGGSISHVETSDKLVGAFVLTNGGYQVLSATSNSFAVVNPLTAFAISTLNNVMAGTPQSVTVTALNGSATSTSYTGTVTFSSTDSAAGLPSSYTFTGADAGVHTFTNGVTFKTAGTQTIGVADTSAHISQTGNTVTVTAGAPVSLTALSGTPQSAATGAAFATPLSIQLLDVYGNPVSGQTVTFTAPASGAGATLASATCQTTAAGTCPVTAMANGTPGNYTVTATAGALSVNFALTNTGPATYTVTVATDTTSGVASNCTVNATTDSNCSLRDAIAAATALNVPSITPTIQFAGALTSGGAATITEGSAGTLTLGANMNIVGPGQTLLAIDGANLYEVMAVNGGVTATISGVTVQYGHNLSTGGAVTAGAVTAGGIANQGTLTVTDSTISGNNAGVSSGGGITSSLGTLSLIRCTIANNTGGHSGGGVYSGSGALTISGSSITGNMNLGSSQNGGGGVAVSLSSVSISNSTISGNSSSGYGGGLNVIGGSATLTNVTMSGNSANVGTLSTTGTGGGIYNDKATLTLIQATVSGNFATASSSGLGGGIYTLRPGSTTLENSVVAGNTASTSYPNLGGSFTDSGGNVFDATAMSSLQPNLAPLGNYGGATQTQPGLPGSPILCAGLASNVGTLTADERGNPRPASYGANQCVDAGAVQTAYSLSFSTQPSNTETGLTLTPAPAVALSDHGAAIPLAGAPIAIALANGTLNGTATATTDATGTATFSGLSIPQAETGDTLTASVAAGANTVTATSGTFDIVSVNHFAFTVIPTTATAGLSFSVTVTAYTSTDNSQVATGYSGPVTITSTDPNAVLPAGTLTLNAGTNSFGITLKTAGAQTITVADSSGSPSVTSGAITLSPSVAALISTASPAAATQSAVIGAAFGTALGVKVTDIYGNPVGGSVVTFLAPATGASAVLSATTCTTGTVAATLGTCTVTATANGTASPSAYSVIASSAGQSAAFSLTNRKASPSLTVTISPTTLVYGQPVTITATSSIASLAGSSPTGAVTFYDTTTTLTPTGTLSNGTASYTTYAGAGAQYYEASLAADSNFNGVAETGTVPFGTPVNKASSTLTGPAGTTMATYGTAGSIAINVGGQYAGGRVLYPSGSIGYTLNGVAGTAAISPSGVATIPIPNTLAANTYTVPVTYSGDALYTGAASIDVSLQVGQLTPAVTYPAQANIPYGTTLAANLDATTAYGTTSLTGGGTTTYTAALQPAGTPVAATASTVLGAGTYTLTATWTPNSNNAALYKTVTGTTTLTVTQASQTIAFAPASPVTFGVAPIALAATGGGSGNPITYTVGGGSPATLNGSTLTVTGAGTVTLTANQAGNANYTAASPVTASIVVSKAAVGGVALTSSVNPVLLSNATLLTATVTSASSTPSGSVTFNDGTTPLGTVALTNGVATLSVSTLTVGTHTLTAIYSGDGNFTGTSSSSISEQVDDFNLSISATGATGTSTTQTILPGGSATFNFTLSPTGTTTFPSAVNLTVSGLPTGATYTITPASLAAGSGSTNVTLTVAVPRQTSMLRTPGMHTPGRFAPMALALLLLPFAGRMRRSARGLGRIAAMLLLLIASAGAVAGLTGCGSSTGFFGQTQQTYNVTITGTSGALSHSTTVTLTVE